MTQKIQDLERVKEYLRTLAKGAHFDEVVEKKDLLEGRYYICPPGDEPHKITLMFQSKDDANKFVPLLARKHIQFQRPEAKLYLVKILIKSAVGALPAEPKTPPASPLPPLPAPPEAVAKPSVAKPIPDIEALLKTIRADKDFGFTNTCSRKTPEGKYRILYFKTTDQATLAASMLMEANDKVRVSARGVFVPSTGKIRQKSASRKPAQPKNEPQTARTSDDVFSEYKKLLRTEIEQAQKEEFDKLRRQVLELDQLLSEIRLDNYVIPKKGSAVITFAFDEVSKGGIQMNAKGFSIKKELLAPFCQKNSKV